MVLLAVALVVVPFSAGLVGKTVSELLSESVGAVAAWLTAIGLVVVVAWIWRVEARRHPPP